MKNNFNENLFLLMNRTSSGYTIATIEDKKAEYDVHYNIFADLWNNALAFRITDDGEIGYRYLIYSDDKEYDIVEGYSKKHLIQDDKWHHIMVQIKFIHNEMKLYFYVDANLVFISKSLPKLNLRILNDIPQKQETVPFNISVGGGTQGLLEAILPNYMDDVVDIYPLTRHFGGTFIGFIKFFKIYGGNVNFETIQEIYQKYQEIK
jgi:hypothetical protein